MKRSGKFYRNNEAGVMKALGLKPTINSGSGWIEKEDGQNEDVICQLKSTDASSIKVSKKDLDTLNYNASVTHKLPVFAIQFLSSNETYLVLKPEVLNEVVKYLETGEHVVTSKEFIDVDIDDYEETTTNGSRIKSSSRGREKFHEERNKKYERKRSAT